MALNSVVREVFFFNKRKHIGNINIGPIFSVKMKPHNCISSKFYDPILQSLGSFICKMTTVSALFTELNDLT